MSRMIPPAVVKDRCVEIAEALEGSDLPRLTAASGRAEVDGSGAPPIPWARARERFEEDAGISPTHWPATACPDGRPHVMPVWTVWVDGAFYFVSGATTRKRRNLAHYAHCVITIASLGLDLVVEGEAAKVSDPARLQRVADAYATQGWHPTARNGVFYAD